MVRLKQLNLRKQLFIKFARKTYFEFLKPLQLVMIIARILKNAETKRLIRSGLFKLWISFFHFLTFLSMLCIFKYIC